MRKFVSGISHTKNPYWNHLNMTRLGENVHEEGIIKALSYDPHPTTLPLGFQWTTYDLLNPLHLHQVTTLLENHYIQLDEHAKSSMTKELLSYKLLKPGYITDLFLGIKDSNTKEIVGFYSGVPHQMIINGKEIRVCEHSNLCIAPKWRKNYQFAKIMSNELIRRSLAHNIMVDIMSYVFPISQQPFTESNNYEILLKPNLYRKQVHGIREMKESDIPQVHYLYSTNTKKYKAYYAYSMKDIRHFMLPKENAVQTLVVEKNGRITDFISYTYWKYIIDNSSIRYAELDSYAATETTLKELVFEVMVDAYRKGFKFVSLQGLMGYESLANDPSLEFKNVGYCFSYYLVNYRMKSIKPNETSIVLT